MRVSGWDNHNRIMAISDKPLITIHTGLFIIYIMRIYLYIMAQWCRIWRKSEVFMSKTKRVLADYDSVINPDKFWSWVDKKGADDCWLFKGGINTTGYGLFSLPSPEWLYEKTGRTKTQLLAHRVAYYLEHKAIHGDDDYNYICHKCDVRLCCNPSHMFIGSIYDNVHDMINKGRGFWQTKRTG